MVFEPEASMSCGPLFIEMLRANFPLEATALPFSAEY